MTNLDRFLKYIKIDTASDAESKTRPTTQKQKNLSNLLVEELKELGLKDAHMEENGNVYAHLEGEGNPIGFNAHIDTSPEVNGNNINPKIINDYDGKDIILDNNVKMKIKDFPILASRLHHILVTTDGKTLLGADDKAGIAIIMSALSYFNKHPQENHHPISIAFTTDEEVGKGHDGFNYKKMNADYAYSFDGEGPNEINYQNFNATRVEIDITGFVIHPGEGKNTLVNASHLLLVLLNSLPRNKTPYNSEGLEGYWNISKMSGDMAKANATLILRDFDNVERIGYLETLKKEIKNLMKKYPKAKIDIHSIEEYQNMEEAVKKKYFIVEKAIKALKDNKLNPEIKPIRGGTDGATFSKNGLITPNLGTGSYNHHGIYEFLDVNEYEQLIKVAIALMRNN